MTPIAPPGSASSANRRPTAKAPVLAVAVAVKAAAGAVAGVAPVVEAKASKPPPSRPIRSLMDKRGLAKSRQMA
jgi:hypothetical protein